MIHHSDCYLIGNISKTHALQGEVVFNFTDDIFDTSDSSYILIEVDGILVPFFIEEYRFRGDSSALLKLEDIDSVEQARTLVGCDVYFEKAVAAQTEQEEMSLQYFIGFTVIDENGQSIGTITDIDDNTENWLFVVERPDGSEALIPAHEEFITNIDHEERKLFVDLPIGLLEL